MDTKKVLHIVLNSFQHDSRVLREISALHELNMRQLVFCLYDKGLKRHETLPDHRIRRFRLYTKILPKMSAFQLIKYAECFLRMIWVGCRRKPHIVHAHDLHGLVIGWFIAFCSGAHLVYDSHEYWQDSAYTRKLPRWMQKILPAIEGFCARRCDAVISVSDSIVDLMHERLRLPHRPTLLRNIPKLQQDRPELALRRRLNISQDTLVLLYQGALTRARGLFLLIEAFAELKPANTALVFLGNGADVDRLHETIAARQLQDSVFHLPAVPPEILFSYTADADIGVSPIQATNLSYEYSLPNKIFEFIHAGLAIFASDLTEISFLIHNYNIGQTFKRDDRQDLVFKLRLLLENPALIDIYKNNSRQAAHILNWDTEQEALLHLYKHLR